MSFCRSLIENLTEEKKNPFAAVHQTRWPVSAKDLHDFFPSYQKFNGF